MELGNQLETYIINMLSKI